MRMLVTLEFADAGTKSGTHRVLIIGRAADNLQAGDIGLSLDEAKTLMTATQEEFVSGQAAPVRLRQEAQHQGLEVAPHSHSVGSGVLAEPAIDQLRLRRK